MLSPVTSHDGFLWDQVKTFPSWMETPKPGRENFLLCSGTSTMITLECVSLQCHSVICTEINYAFYELKVARVILHISISDKCIGAFVCTLSL